MKRGAATERTASGRWLFVFAVALLSWFRPAGAMASGRDAVRQAHQAALDETGAAQYAALRKVWRLWETEDPNEVEAALLQLRSSKKLSEAARAYAGLFTAYARRRRGDLAGARRGIEQLGFVDRWLVLGPFDNDNKSGLSRNVLAEKELLQPIDTQRAFVGKTHPVRWSTAADVHPYGYVDFGALMRPREAICVMGATFVRGPRIEASLWLAAQGSVRVYIDEHLALEDTAYRHLDADRHAVAFELDGQWRRITVKVCGAASAPALALRIADRKGAPLDGVFVEASEAVSVKHAARRAARKTRTSGRHEIFGPLKELRRRVAAKPDDPQALHAWAEFLVRTGADPEAEHLARDAASRAATIEGSFDRLMLAAELAEDRNGRRKWLDMAEAYARTDDKRVRLALARGRLERSGSHWLKAVPHYDRVLAIHPHHVQATVSKADLYIEAGLPRVALSALLEASMRRPRNVALLRALAGQYRALGRDREARLAADRYASLRFDDGGYIKEQMDVALARRDRKALQHWASRLIAVEPSSLWARGVVARARRGLGDHEGAEKAYRDALTIAPDDRATLGELAELYGEQGRRNEQIAMLKRVLRAAPQDDAVRRRLHHLEPRARGADEQHAWPAERFLALRQSGQKRGKRIIRQLNVTTLYDNGTARRFHQTVFQPRDEEAAKRAKNFVFAYHADRQLARVRSAKVYRRSGRVDEAMRTYQTPLNDPSINMYTLQRRFVIELPALDVGDIVDIRYRVDDVLAESEMAGHFGEIEYVQGPDPVERAEYFLSAPSEKSLRVAVQGVSPSTSTTKAVGERTERYFLFENVPQVRLEPMMPPLSELAGHVHVSSFGRWKEVGQWYARLSGDKADVDDAVRAKAQALVAGATSAADKVARIYRYVSTELRYVALEFGIEGIRPRRAALTLARGWGDCKDKATLLVSLLREVGVKAELVLVRTQLRGLFPTETPSLVPFDHAIAYIPELDLYLDGTAELTGTKELPVMDRDAVALRITDKGGQLVRLPNPEAKESVDERTVTLRLSKDGKLTFDGRVSVRGAVAPRWRARFASPATRRDRIAAEFAGLLGDLDLERGSVQGGAIPDFEKPVTLLARGVAAPREDAGGYVIPVGRAWRLTRRYASLPSRNYPVVLGAKRTYRSRWSLTLPPTMRTRSLPKPVRLVSEQASFTRVVERKGSRIDIQTEFTVRQSRVSPASYERWRSFCQKVDAFGSPLVMVSGSP